MSDSVDAVGKDVDVTDAKGQAAGDEPDAKGKHGGGKGAGPVPFTDAAFFSEEYNMDHPKRGYAIIFNNRDFDRHTQMGTRTGTDVDAAKINQILKSCLDFETELRENQTRREMKDMMKTLGKADHSQHDCFACVILSHGEEGTVYGKDGPIEIKELVEPFKGHNCKTLAGKPKLFFIQACRGQGLDDGQTVGDAIGVKADDDVEMEPVTYRIPTEADFLMAYSVVPGYFSWRNSSKGSWFMQALCAVLEKYGETLDLMTMMTRVNKIVAYEFESNASKEFMNRKKQIPCITSMLTKDVYFRPKK